MDDITKLKKTAIGVQIISFTEFLAIDVYSL